MLLLFGLFLSVIFFAHPVWAHEIQTDKAISVLLHVEPQDNPVAGQVATLNFAVNDADNRFSAKTCRCFMTVKTSQKTLYSVRLGYVKNTSIFGLSGHSVFPAKGSYTVELQGSPMQSKGFQPFTVEFGVAVNQTDSTALTTLAARRQWHEGVEIIITLVMAALLVWIRKTT